VRAVEHINEVAEALAASEQAITDFEKTKDNLRKEIEALAEQKAAAEADVSAAKSAAADVVEKAKAKAAALLHDAEAKGAHDYEAALARRADIDREIAQREDVKRGIDGEISKAQASLKDLAKDRDALQAEIAAIRKSAATLAGA